ncbi:hypothetical protein L873DRAFT_1841029 [Choiromyces venosus 120613-1]|uniref:Uncharacterized protein n=1 Tax=Choiromyces venosus 120613-1 TaxID=1336337 RepID=A0A3N4K5Z1_9PEZI|nr:hypothetical protein L873DRAFT_1841029 [Choiromyces venosus 120613-1]
MPSCQVEAWGHPTICIGCKHPTTIHYDDANITILGSSSVQLASTSSSTTILPFTNQHAARSSAISTEVNLQRQCTNISKQPGRSNILTSLGQQPAKPVARSLALFIFPKGNTRGSFHGVPTIMHFLRSKLIPDWQHYLTNQVLQHPTWTTYPNIKQYIIDSDHPICVGYWEGNSNTPNANALVGGGTIADLLHLTENPKNLAGTQQPPSRRSGRTTTTFHIAYTVFIRRIGMVYSDKELELSEAIVDGQEIKKELTEKRLQKPFHRRIQPQQLPSSSPEDSDSESKHVTQSTQDIILSVPPPSQLPVSRLSTPISNTLHATSVLHKRSLTMLSPEKVSTRSM